MTVTRARRVQLLVGLAVIVVVVGLVIWAADDGGNDGRSTAAATTTGAPPSATSTTGPDAGAGTPETGVPAPTPGATAPGGRPAGEGTCAFLSTDDVARVADVTKVELRQTLGPGGGPGCEWVLGEERAALQLEFLDAVPGGAPPIPEGEAVSGPWEDGRWVVGTRSVYVKGSDLSILVRSSDTDPARAKTVATKLAALALERS